MTDIPVDVWFWTLGVPRDDVARLASFLSPDEVARAQRFLSDADRDGYIVGRGTLRRVLAKYTGLPADRLTFSYGEAGKPRLEGASAPHFNLSHSGGHAAVAISPACPVGIDIETVRPIKDQLAERFFSPAEAAALAALPPDEQTAGFFRCWTRKEAVVKALGGGLNIPLDSFTVSVNDEPFPAMLHIDNVTSEEVSRWKLFDFSPAPDFAGALAVKAEHVEHHLNVHMNLQP